MTAKVLKRLSDLAAKHERDLQKAITEHFTKKTPTLPQAIQYLDTMETEQFKNPTPVQYAGVRVMAALVSSWVDSVFLRTVSLKQAERIIKGDSK